MRSYWDFYSAGKLLFGTGVIHRLGAEMRQRGFSKPLIITDPNLQQAGIVDQVIQALGDEVSASVFEGGEAEPSLNAAQAALETAQSVQPDVMIGLGGGSNMDLAKATAMLYTHGGSPSDYFGFDQVPGPVTPLIGIPTTAGTGSEVSHAAVLTDSEHQLKVSSLSAHLRPTLALIDPALTRTCPAKVTAESGMDALTHAIEAYTAKQPKELSVGGETHLPYPGKNPMADLFAEKAIRLVGKSLLKAVQNGDDMQAREDMALAATLAGLAFSNGAVAVVHALEYPMGVALHCSHGQGNGLLLPFVMAYNQSARLEAFAEIAGFLGCDTRGMSVKEASDQAIESVHQLKSAVGIPKGIRDLGGKEDQLTTFADKAIQIERLMDINAKQPSRDDLLGILRSAF